MTALMATIQVILAGQLRTTIHDTFDYPLVLQFNDKKNYDEAEWVIPSYPRHIPAHRLSEIRVQEGNVSVLVDGPEMTHRTRQLRSTNSTTVRNFART